MAQREKKEHAYNRINKDLKSNVIAGPLLFYGREKFLIEWAVGMMEKQWINPAAKELDRNNLSWEGITLNDLMDFCETVPMLSEKRLVILRDIKNPGEDFAAYLDQIPETCQLIMIWEDPDKRTKAYKEIARKSGEYEFGILDEPDLRKYIDKRFRQAGKSIPSSRMNQLIQRTGYYDKDSLYTLNNLENDLKKIIAHCNGQEVGEEDIRAGVLGNLETNVFEMLDAITGNKKEEAFRLLHNLMVTGENIYYLLAVIIGQFETILEIKELREEGMDPASMHRLTGIHEFRIKKALQQGERISVRQLKTTLSRLYEVDRNIKNGQMEGLLALELIIAGV